MVEDLIKRIRRDVAVWEAGDDLQSSQPMIDAANLIEHQGARLTALESERDALLAAAGKEAVAWFHNTARDGDKPVYEQVADEYACPPAIPLCLCAPTAALEKGDGRDAIRNAVDLLNNLAERQELAGFPLTAASTRHTAKELAAALSQKAGEQHA
jgi:hypothetical protein